MYAGGIQRILAVGDTKEACALLIGLGSQLWNVEKIRSLLELAVLFSIVNDVLADGGSHGRLETQIPVCLLIGGWKI